MADIKGKSMIMRVVEQARKCKWLEDVVVATDDQRIADHVANFGGRVVMTSANHLTGTDRCLEALQKLNERYDAVINVQGDEPFVDPALIESIAVQISLPSIMIVTLAKRINDEQTLHDPNKVKVVITKMGQALYFSRQAIPFLKGETKDWHKHFPFYKHIGLYAYKTVVLERIGKLEPSALERAESLEQLRWMENGIRIHVVRTEIETPSIDTPEDLQRVLESMK